MPRFAQNPINQFEPERLSVGWPWRLLSVSFILFLISILTYLGLIIGYVPYLESKLQEKEAQISQLAQSVSQDDQEAFIQFYSQLNNLKDLLDNHVISSNLFSKLEQMTNQKVYYTSADLNTGKRALELEGFADSYSVLGEQLEAYNQADEINRYILNNSQMDGPLVRFKVTLELNRALLK